MVLASSPPPKSFRLRRMAVLCAGFLLVAIIGALTVGRFSPVASQVHGSGVVPETRFLDPPVLQAFYQERAMRPVWVRGVGGFQPRIDAVLDILDESWSHGLNPAQYHVEDIRTLLGGGPLAGERAMTLDMLLSDGVMRYARDLTGMRHKNNVPRHLADHWRHPMPPQDIIQVVMKSADPVAALRRLEPRSSLYHALRREMMVLSSDQTPEAPPITLKQALRPGDRSSVILLLRARLGMPQPERGGEIYDDELAARVMDIQRRNELRDDAHLNRATLAVLNKTRRDRMLQIAANMERLRWLDQERPDRYVLVNIPSARLWAVENGEVALEMDVIVGKSARPTYSFKTDISGVRFNPSWTVPPTIKREDFLPMLIENPASLSGRNMEFYYNGETFDPAQADWSTVDNAILNRIRMVQRPGPDNPLGRIRILMDNPYNIYLHDTNNRSAFGGDERALSSGCVRIAEPEKLAHFILKGNKDWNEARMQALFEAGRMRDIRSEIPLPVFITYQTIWLDSDGALVYGPDVYGQDAVLTKLLEKNNSIHIPNASKNNEISL